MNPRLAPIVLAVVCAHGLALWALQSALQRTAPQPESSIVMVASLVDPVQPIAPAPPPPPPAPAKAPAPPAPKKTPAPSPVPVKPRAEPAPKPVIEREAATAEPQSPTETINLDNPVSAPQPQTTPTQVSAPLVAQAPPAPPPVELPNSSARHLNNPKPPYPALSKRMGEQGTVVVRAWIGLDGTASQVSVRTSSGYPRLDRSAVEAIQRWRFVPGKRAGVPEAMSYDIPLTFTLDR
ncbi:MAG: energy transducer TonB [Burkholderiaceae bacterium]